MNDTPDLMPKEALTSAFAALTGERITEKYIDSRIVKREFHRLGETMTVCILTLDNGFTSLGKSACVDPANYRKNIGERIAHDNAYNKLWPLFGFMLAERRMWEGKIADSLSE